MPQSFRDKRSLTIKTDFPQAAFDVSDNINSMDVTKIKQLVNNTSMRTVFRGSLPAQEDIPTRPDHFFQSPPAPRSPVSCCCSCCRKDRSKQAARTVMC